MTDEERVASINAKSVEHIENWIQQLDDGELEPDDLLAATYAALVTAIILGYSPEDLIDDAKKAAANLDAAFQAFGGAEPEQS